MSDTFNPINEPLVEQFIHLLKKDMENPPLTQDQLRSNSRFSEEITVDELGAVHIKRRLHFDRSTAESIIVEPYRIDVK